MVKYNKQAILDEYNNLCMLSNKRLTRADYRNYDTSYSSTLIESIWGSWSNFIKDAEADLLIARYNIIKEIDSDVDKMVITYVTDGSEINEDFYYTLLNYCKENKAEFGILWGKSLKKKQTFNMDVFNLLQPYLATKFEFKKDNNCLVQDFLIPPSQKNPLLNLDKLSTNIKTIVVGATKQYMQILPYKQYTDYRIAYSTGTLSLPDYKDTVAGNIDLKYHKYGAILLEYNKDQKRYIVRNLIYNNDSLYDLNKVYTKNSVKKLDSLPYMVLGDLHLPDQDYEVLEKTLEFINKYNVKEVALHDVASWNSICHHDFGHYLTQARNLSPETSDLKSEVEAVVTNLNFIASSCKKCRFNIVNSNHDMFVEKWLENGEFIKDRRNAVFGAKLFIKYCNNQHILDNYLPNNVFFMEKNKEYNVLGYVVSEHGDAGISGASGSPNAFNKTFENCICGHTHSPEIREKTVYAGTLSKLIMNYNQKGMTKWVHANVLIQNNSTFQLILL